CTEGNAMRRRSRERGFSLILVMIAIVVITLVGTSVVYTSGADLLSAGARQRSALARQVAEAGLNHYALLGQPSLIAPVAIVGQPPGQGQFNYQDVLEGMAPIHTEVLPNAPPGHSASYVVWAGAQIDDGVQIILEGRLHPAGDTNRILARSRISTVIVMTSGTSGYSGTVGWTPRNTGVLGGGLGEGYAGW